ncbi:hypothetical protein OPV22_034063 [Ensete ventricosum]|uniref:Uncharacterized protein n=1 Tax=Ensete ventricosum TaxID=4639 RepID=A0AAV8Q001_ENSVE|nr:hypothetical protein OPV22_034063 [Ensete ventricosum]
MPGSRVLPRLRCCLQATHGGGACYHEPLGESRLVRSPNSSLGEGGSHHRSHQGRNHREAGGEVQTASADLIGGGSGDNDGLIRLVLQRRGSGEARLNSQGADSVVERRNDENQALRDPEEALEFAMQYAKAAGLCEQGDADENHALHRTGAASIFQLLTIK